MRGDLHVKIALLRDAVELNESVVAGLTQVVL